MLAVPLSPSISSVSREFILHVDFIGVRFRVSLATHNLSTPFFSGYAFAFGGQDDRTDTTFIGTTDFAGVGSSAAFWFFQYTFSATSVTIVAGTLAERCQMAAYLCYSVFLAGFVYPVVAHSVWSTNGFLSPSNIKPLLDIGAVDFAGSGVVHLTGGTTALYATLILGARRGRFYDAKGEELETPKSFPGHSVALQLLGTMILWFGCKFPFCNFHITLSQLTALLNNELSPSQGSDSTLVRLCSWELSRLVRLLPTPQSLLLWRVLPAVSPLSLLIYISKSAVLENHTFLS
jgi:hypothetical protein